jgi:hypothetical protein
VDAGAADQGVEPVGCMGTEPAEPTIESESLTESWSYAWCCWLGFLFFL